MGLFMFGMATPLALAKLPRYQVVLLSLELVSPLSSLLHCEYSAKDLECPNKGQSRPSTALYPGSLFSSQASCWSSDETRRACQPASGPGDSRLAPVIGCQASYFAPFSHGSRPSSLSLQGALRISRRQPPLFLFEALKLVNPFPCHNPFILFINLSSLQYRPAAPCRIRPRLGYTDDGHYIAMPSYALYPSMPWTSRCLFSVASPAGGERWLQRPLPRQQTFCLDEETIWIHAFALRWHHPVEACQVVRPRSWNDLWEYFDCYDLWHNGPWNLWNLLNNLADINEAWDWGIRTRLAPLWNWHMYDSEADSEAEFEKAVFKLKLAVQRGFQVAFENGVFRDRYNRPSWPHGQLWWFDWETNLRDLWVGEPVGEARLGCVQMSTETESNVAEKGSDAEELDDEDWDDEDWEDEDLDNDEESDDDDDEDDDDLDMTTLVETCANLNMEDVRVLHDFTTEWARIWIGRSGNKRKLCGWRRAFDILSVLSDNDWEVDLGRPGSAALTVSLCQFPPRPRIRHSPRRLPIPHSSLGDFLPGALFP